jgi:hypothetical protein
VHVSADCSGRLLLSKANTLADGIRAVLCGYLRASLPMKTIVLVILSVVSSVESFAWGPVGHRAVGHIADQRISPQTRAAVAELLGDEALAEASLWADGIRSEPKWRQTGPWHYVNIPDDQAYDPAHRSRDGDVLEALERFTAVLRNPNSRRIDKVVALRFIAHFVGDIHQPLHVGRASDRGGNEIDLNWFGQRSNLHRVWDSGIISRERITPGGLVNKLASRPSSEVAAWAQDIPLVWAAESMALRPLVYGTPVSRLGRSFAREAGLAVEGRLMQAGVRLASLLDAIFE